MPNTYSGFIGAQGSRVGSRAGVPESLLQDSQGQTDHSLAPKITLITGSQPGLPASGKAAMSALLNTCCSIPSVT